MIYKTRQSADAAARRWFRKLHGAGYRAKVGVDFILMDDFDEFDGEWMFVWTYQIIDEKMHLREAERNAAERNTTV